MAVGLPLKTTYADGDVYSASDVNDTNGTINAYLAPSLGYAAGKNKIINGDFFVNQRAFTSSTSDNIFPFDRWKIRTSGGTCTTSVQTFTPGTAPVAGYEGRTFLRAVITGQSAAGDFYQVRQYIEDVTNFAGQTITLSFWAKAATGTPSIAPTFVQNFGTGGSPSAGVQATTAQKKAITTSWARYSYTFAIASIAGKTLGTTANTSSLELKLHLSGGSNFDSEDDTLGVQNNTFDIWGVQVEAGSVATAFQTATGSIQGELAACQRYYFRASVGSIGNAIATSTTAFEGNLPLPVAMRIKPATLDSSATRLSDGVTITNTTALSLNAGNSSVTNAYLTGTVASGLTQYRPYFFSANAGYYGLSAEL
jgi:hypothetical protein